MAYDTGTTCPDEQFTEEYIADKKAEFEYDRFCRSQEAYDPADYVEF